MTKQTYERKYLTWGQAAYNFRVVRFMTTMTGSMAAGREAYIWFISTR